MSLSKASWVAHVRRNLPTPTGVLAVFWWRMRTRCALRDLLGAGLALVGLLALAALLQTVWLQIDPYHGAPDLFLGRWLRMGLAVTLLTFLPLAVVLGAGSAPARSEFETVQSALLTRLTAFDICLGRLLAGLWLLVSTSLASCAVTLGAQLVWRPFPGAARGYLEIAAAYACLLGSILFAGALGFLFALKRRPGRNGWLGVAAGLTIVLCCLLSPVLLTPLARALRLRNPVPLYETALLVNPLSAALAALQSDSVRLPGVYDLNDAHDYDFTYPSPTSSAVAFFALAAAAQGAAAGRLRRAYR